MNDRARVIRVVLVDDHPVVRAGLRALIDGLDDVAVTGEAHDLVSAERVVALDHPDVVLMDLNLGDGAGGAEVTARLRALPDPPHVLVLTTYDTESDILRALDAGANGYLLKDAPADELFAGIRAAARGETILASSVAALLVRRASSPGPVVTDREVEVLELLARGLGNKEMAHELFVSEATVKSHLSHIYAKLGVDTRAGAVAAAIERRIIRR
jgi:DNA-binding NarL/FixJ family response regulator